MNGCDDSPEGKVGFVTVAIPGAGRAGEVRVAIRGGTEHFIAYAEQPIARGSEVLIIADRGARAVDVVAG
ncbi:MAG TPA: hypothetical protein VMD59_03385 [Acidimicrobiales bacterium]|nr:hypothetical protein [Acidimicrobiales bacterium]